MPSPPQKNLNMKDKNWDSGKFVDSDYERIRYKIGTSTLHSLQHSLQNSAMIKSFYECMGWSADDPILCDEGMLVKLHVNSELASNCPQCGCPLCMHTKKVINGLDLPTCDRTT